MEGLNSVMDLALHMLLSGALWPLVANFKVFEASRSPFGGRETGNRMFR